MGRLHDAKRHNAEDNKTVSEMTKTTHGPRLRTDQSWTDYERERRRRIRGEVLAAYGGKCECCGESRHEFLGIDHILNDGSIERRKLGSGASNILYGKLKRAGFPKDRHRLLCHNCNLARGFYGHCPHEDEHATRARREIPRETVFQGTYPTGI